MTVLTKHLFEVILKNINEAITNHQKPSSVHWQNRFLTSLELTVAYILQSSYNLVMFRESLSNAEHSEMQNKLVLKTILMEVTVMVVSLLPSQSRTKILVFNHKLSFNFTSFQKYVLMEVLGFGWVVYVFFQTRCLSKYFSIGCSISIKLCRLVQKMHTTCFKKAF